MLKEIIPLQIYRLIQGHLLRSMVSMGGVRMGKKPYSSRDSPDDGAFQNYLEVASMEGIYVNFKYCP